MLHNPRFAGSVFKLKKAIKQMDLQDNVYAEAKPAYMFPFRDCKLATVKTQTNLLELLALDELIDSQMRRHFML